jgi:hypothetical protein
MIFDNLRVMRTNLPLVEWRGQPQLLGPCRLFAPQAAARMNWSALGRYGRSYAGWSFPDA